MITRNHAGPQTRSFLPCWPLAEHSETQSLCLAARCSLYPRCSPCGRCSLPLLCSDEVSSSPPCTARSHYPGGSDTGIGWTYLRYPHAAATAWTGLLMLYQWDKSECYSTYTCACPLHTQALHRARRAPPRLRASPALVVAPHYTRALFPPPTE